MTLTHYSTQALRLAAVHHLSRLTFSEFSDALKRLCRMDHGVASLICPCQSRRGFRGHIWHLGLGGLWVVAVQTSGGKRSPWTIARCVMQDCILGMGADFKAVLSRQPIQLATQTVALLCTGMDVDGSLSSRQDAQSPGRAGSCARPTIHPPPYQAGFSFNFQQGRCYRPNCKY